MRKTVTVGFSIPTNSMNPYRETQAPLWPPVRWEGICVEYPVWRTFDSIQG
jgi:hypothetical protein